jgi:hypothetical protein
VEGRRFPAGRTGQLAGFFINQFADQSQQADADNSLCDVFITPEAINLLPERGSGSVRLNRKQEK